MHVHVFTPCFQCMLVHVLLHIVSAYNLQHNVHRLRQPIDWCSMNCFHASIHEHTHHHVHKSLYTLMFFFYDKLVVYMCIKIYTFTIACMYSLHAYSRVHCMFSVHASTNICASSTTTDDRCSMNCFHTSIHHRTVCSLLLIVHLVFDILLLLMPRWCMMGYCEELPWSTAFCIYGH